MFSRFRGNRIICFSEDFNLRQLLHINSPEILSGLECFKRYEHIWFWRFDDRSPAEFLNAHRNDVDALVVSFFSRGRYRTYLQSEANFAYTPREEKTACVASSCLPESASDTRVLRALKARSNCGRGTGFLARNRSSPPTQSESGPCISSGGLPAEHEFDLNHVWPDRLISYERVFLSSDGRTEVVKSSCVNLPEIVIFYPPTSPWGEGERMTLRGFVCLHPRFTLARPHSPISLAGG